MNWRHEKTEEMAKKDTGERKGISKVGTDRHLDILYGACCGSALEEQNPAHNLTIWPGNLL